MRIFYKKVKPFESLLGSSHELHLCHAISLILWQNTHKLLESDRLVGDYIYLL